MPFTRHGGPQPAQPGVRGAGGQDDPRHGDNTATRDHADRSIGNSNGIFQRPGGEPCALQAAGRLTRRSCLATGDGQHALRGGGSRHSERRLESRTSG